jgi:cytochrome c553
MVSEEKCRRAISRILRRRTQCQRVPESACYEYLVEAMRAFADGDRTNNADMVKIMQELSPAKRQEIAKYISSL